MKKKLITVSGLVLGFMPMIALAQVQLTGNGANCKGGASSTIFSLMCRAGALLNGVVPVLIALAVVYFIWGVISYVLAGDEEAKSAGRDRIIFGIIGLAVIVAVWGLVRILTETFGVDNDAKFDLPTVKIEE